ncbi:MAG: TIGR00730 family Rossman fold protein [Hellea sp.]|nr:TIGR00730 family Rossman fold protein [Hellea sp.]
MTDEFRSICVFCGSSAGNHPKYLALAKSTGKAISQDGFRFVYGGGSFGLMGASARAAFENGGKVLGIIPEFLVRSEGAFTEAEHRIVPNMHVRKMEMYQESDAFIILPGGIGTIEEAVEVLSWMRLQLHQKPVIFLSEDEYWEPLLGLIRHTIDIGFTPAWIKDDLLTTTSPSDAIEIIKKEWSAPKDKRSIWVDYDDI